MKISINYQSDYLRHTYGNLFHLIFTLNSDQNLRLDLRLYTLARSCCIRYMYVSVHIDFCRISINLKIYE